VVIYNHTMKFSDTIKKVREAKNLSQKEVANALKMDASQYSKIENGKTDPSFTIIDKIAKALGVTLSELFRADEIFIDTHSQDKTLMEKIRLLDTLEDKDKESLYHIIDTFIAKKKLKDNILSLAAQ
jgi:transcriptional regulator with XRE-family HTH domain